MIATCFSTGSGWNCGCLRISVSARPRVELVAGRLVEVGGELRERGQLAVLGEVEAQLAGDLAHGLDLGVATHAARR